jgi:5S rRNA maturation endonuclease (ribonuclease M5)
MTHRLATTGKFQIKELQVDASGNVVRAPVEGNIHHLQGMFGFIDWIDLTYRKRSETLDEGPTSIDKVYGRFLLHRDFWASSVPMILCEGKTDSVYLRGAIRRLASAHPILATGTAPGKVDYKVRFFNYSYTAQRILDISGGASRVKTFITKYLKSVKNIPAPADQKPVVVLLDNDSGGKQFYSLIKQYDPKNAYPSGLDDFYPLGANVYVVFTPITNPGDESTIEKFFDPALLTTKLGGKSFNPSNDNIDENSEYSKAIFATQVVRPNIGKIDFTKFDPILSRIEAVIKAHEAKHTAVP